MDRGRARTWRAPGYFFGRGRRSLYRPHDRQHESMSRVLDAETVVVGMDLRWPLPWWNWVWRCRSLKTALNVDAGMAPLKSAGKMSGKGRLTR